MKKGVFLIAIRIKNKGLEGQPLFLRKNCLEKNTKYVYITKINIADKPYYTRERNQLPIQSLFREVYAVTLNAAFGNH